MSEFSLTFRMVPFLDTDIRRLFTQTYSTLTALGRWHYVFSSQFKKAALKDGWIPVTIAETIRFKKSIFWFEKVELKTQMICWNERCFFLRQTFLVKGEVRVVAFTEGVVRNRNGALKPPDVFKTFGIELESPKMPNEIEAWYQMEAYRRDAK